LNERHGLDDVRDVGIADTIGVGVDRNNDLVLSRAEWGVVASVVDVDVDVVLAARVDASCSVVVPVAVLGRKLAIVCRGGRGVRVRRVRV
jgi:hypothetical protein